ncbi:uncharacterized protein LOC144657622 isoform X2 [Oculina patagonica]
MRDEFRSYNSFNNWWEQSCARNTAAIICIPKSGKAVLAHMKGEKGCFLCEDKGDGVGNGLQRFWLYSTGMLLHMIPMEKLLSGTLFKMENRKCQYFLHRRDWEFLVMGGVSKAKTSKKIHGSQQVKYTRIKGNN